jgi:hypothetical protein
VVFVPELFIRFAEPLPFRCCYIESGAAYLKFEQGAFAVGAACAGAFDLDMLSTAIDYLDRTQRAFSAVGTDFVTKVIGYAING